MANHDNELDTELAKLLEPVQRVPDRNPQNAVRGRAVFLDEALRMQQAVSERRQSRPYVWMSNIRAFFRKERSPMLGTLSTILLVLALILGGGGFTVSAAQVSMPDEPLYGVKMTVEEFQLQLRAGPQSKLDWALQRVERRLSEIQAMLVKGKTPSQAVLARLQVQVEAAIRIAGNQPNEDAVQALAQVRTRLKTMEQDLNRDGSTSEPSLAQVRTLLQERIAWLDEAAVNPDLLRQRLQEMDQLRDQDQFQQHLRTPGSCEDCTPVGTSAGPGPLSISSPGSGQGFGPGPGDKCGECTPAGTALGGPPWTATAAPPENGYGPGPQATHPAATSDDPGPQSTQPAATSSGPGPQSTQPAATSSGPGPQTTRPADNGTGGGGQSK